MSCSEYFKPALACDLDAFPTTYDAWISYLRNEPQTVDAFELKMHAALVKFKMTGAIHAATSTIAKRCLTLIQTGKGPDPCCRCATSTYNHGSCFHVICPACIQEPCAQCGDNVELCLVCDTKTIHRTACNHAVCLHCCVRVNGCCPYCRAPFPYTLQVVE